MSAGQKGFIFFYSLILELRITMMFYMLMYLGIYFQTYKFTNPKKCFVTPKNKTATQGKCT